MRGPLELRGENDGARRRFNESVMEGSVGITLRKKACTSLECDKLQNMLIWKIIIALRIYIFNICVKEKHALFTLNDIKIVAFKKIAK